MASPHSHSTSNEQTVALQLHDVHCTGCADAVVEALHSNPHITSVHLDWPNNVVHVTYHAGMIDVSSIEALIERTGCKCEAGAPGTTHHDHPQQQAQTDLQHLAHAVDVQPVTMGTKHDRMQYEMSATRAQKDHAAAHAAPGPPSVPPRAIAPVAAQADTDGAAHE